MTTVHSGKIPLHFGILKDIVASKGFNIFSVVLPPHIFKLSNNVQRSFIRPYKLERRQLHEDVYTAPFESTVWFSEGKPLVNTCI